MSSKNRTTRRVILYTSLALFLSCIQVEELPGKRDFTDYAREVFLINGQAETLSVLDPGTLAIHNDVVLTGASPNHLLQHGNELFLTNSLDNSITIFDEDTLLRNGEIYLGKNRNPWMIIKVPGTDKAYIPNFAAGTVSVVNLYTREILREIPVGDGPEGGCYLDGKVFICNTAWDYEKFGYGEGTVSVIDTATDRVVETLTVEDSPFLAAQAGGGNPDGSNPQSALAFSDKNEVHVILTGTNGGSAGDDGEILVIDGDALTVKDRISIGGSPSWREGGLDGTTVYLTGVGGLQSYNYQTLEVLHGSDNYILAGNNPDTDFYAGVACDGVNNRIFVADYSHDKVVVLDSVSYDIIDEIQGSDGVQFPFLITE